MRWPGKKRNRPTPPLILGVTVPNGAPGDLMELAAMVALDGAELLVGQNPSRVGLMAVHHRSPMCPSHLRHAGKPSLLVVSRTELERIAKKTSLKRRPPPGTFWAMLLGERQAAGLHIGPPGVDE